MSQTVEEAFFVKVVQTAVAHACDLAVHLVTAQSRRAKTDPAPYSAQKKDLTPRCIHRSQTEPFLELEKNILLRKTYLNKDKI